MTPHPRMVLFDFGNVIARFDNRCFIRRLVPESPDRLEPLMKKIFKESRLSFDFETGKITIDEFQKGIETIIARPFSKDEFQSAFCDIFQCIPETTELVRFLQGKTRIGMLSNTNALHFDRFITTISTFELFDQVTVSFQVGAMKPAAEIYLDAIKKSALSPNEILYLDDIPQFVESARALGIQAWVFDNPAQVCQKVRDLFGS